MKFIIITEANQKVATGHFMETCELTRELMKRGHTVIIIVNSGCPQDLLNRFSYDFFFYNGTFDEDIKNTISVIEEERPDGIITDLREIQNADVQIIKKDLRIPIICIDEFGNRTLDADAIVNPMVDSVFWEYPNSSDRVYAGHRFLVLPELIRKYHKKEKIIRKSINRICISMGGVDPMGTTVKIVKWLPQLFENVIVDIILGAGFEFQSEIDLELSKMPGRINANVWKNVENIYEFFFKADLAICAGGNTLHELACIGTPTIVIPTMPHEKRNGDCFEAMGAVKSLCLAEDIGVDIIRKTIGEMTFDRRCNMSRSGKAGVEGRGVVYTADICEEIVARKGMTEL